MTEITQRLGHYDREITQLASCETDSDSHIARHRDGSGDPLLEPQSIIPYHLSSATPQNSSTDNIMASQNTIF